jgi:hypothetical protein
MTTDAQQIKAIIDSKAAEIEALDDSILMEVVGVAMSVDKLRESLDNIQEHLDAREFEKASQAGYRDLAEHFVYVQRTLAGLQTVTHKMTSLISSVAEEAHTAYEDVAPFVEHRLQSAVKKQISVPSQTDN